MSQTPTREWIVRDHRGDVCEGIMATSPNAAYEQCVNGDKCSVTLSGEIEGWTPGMGHGDLYGGFRAVGFSHSEVARALAALGYSHRANKAAKGGELNERQQALVEKLLCMSQELRLAWAKRASEYGALRDQYIRSKVKMEMAKERLSKWTAEPKTDAQLNAEMVADADRWWKDEGRFESEIEERGEAKYFHWAQEKAAQEGRDLTARDYLSGTDNES